MISSELHSDASAPTVHELLVDVRTWSVWSPHVASVESDSDRVVDGWSGETRAFFAPVATSMIVDEVWPDGGYAWHSTLGPWRLDYENVVVRKGDGCVLRFIARLSGPASSIIERVVAPVSAYGQRRRMARLARLAELIERDRSDAPG
jgi:hypothetical protein